MKNTPNEHEEKEPTEEELENSILNFAESLGKNDIVGQIFLEEFFRIINSKKTKFSK